MSTVGTVRVLIADDHSLFAKTLEALLAGTPGIEVVGVAQDGLEAVGLAVTLSPDVVLMDVEMPHLDVSPRRAGCASSGSGSRSSC